MSWRNEPEPVWSTAEDLQAVFKDWTRVDVLLFLAGPRRGVTELASAMGMRHRSRLSHHLLRLGRARLVECECDGSEHYYSLSPRCIVECIPTGIMIRARADDGAVWNIELPRSARMFGILANGLREGGQPNPPAPISFPNALGQPVTHSAIKQVRPVERVPAKRLVIDQSSVGPTHPNDIDLTVFVGFPGVDSADLR